MGFILEDHDGVTDISLNALRELHEKGEELLFVAITPGQIGHICDFTFKGDNHYVASGFSIGYGGTGPHGLHKAIRLWDDKMDIDFWSTQIQVLDPKRTWVYQVGKGFGTFENFEEEF